MTKVVLLVALFALVVFGAACMPPPIAPSATATPRVVATAETKPTSSDSATLVPSPSPRPSVAPSPTSTTPEVFSFVEDCMDACHIPEASEFYDAGAMAKPADHTGRTTCLECHGKPTAAKPLPATHLGRLDPSCDTCHK